MMLAIVVLLVIIVSLMVLSQLETGEEVGAVLVIAGIIGGVVWLFH